MTLRALCVAAALAALAVTACGDKTSSSPSGPSVIIAPTVTSISPREGATLGGTPVTISGANFAQGASVAIGGVAATNVVVASSTVITAVTGAHAAGPGDVAVTQGGLTATLPAAFTFITLPPPTITSIFPRAGSSAGGTTVTITGTNFAPGASVTIGGAAATAVAVASLTSLTAVTGPRAVGTADVIVTVGGQTGSLAGGFTYVPPGQNLLPVIASLTAQSARPNAPADFADLSEEVPVKAVVSDAETPVDRLTFEWSADIGTVIGSGTSVVWRMPASASTPRSATITLKVIEPVGGSAGTQSVTAKATISLHDSIGEISHVSRQFLLDFSDSSMPASYVVRNFWDGCPGKQDELADVEANRLHYTILSSNIGQPYDVSVGFKAGCAVPGRGIRSGDGCAVVPCLWRDLYKPTGAINTTSGPDYLTAVFRNNRWWLCASDFPSGTTTPARNAPAFIR
ncbi:MAG TPA: IPT/TIG domain-containing protein [Vicinamibacterales bacterium]|nr:IPT/TIG domain-containing protein [Vicinamibacterales bacterium]